MGQVSPQEPREVTRLRLAIVASGYQLREIADMANVNPNDLSRYARGTVKRPHVQKAVRIARALNTTVEELWPADELERAA